MRDRPMVSALIDSAASIRAASVEIRSLSRWMTGIGAPSESRRYARTAVGRSHQSTSSMISGHSSERVCGALRRLEGARNASSDLRRSASAPKSGYADLEVLGATVGPLRRAPCTRVVEERAVFGFVVTVPKNGEVPETNENVETVSVPLENT